MFFMGNAFVLLITGNDTDFRKMLLLSAGHKFILRRFPVRSGFPPARRLQKWVVGLSRSVSFCQVYRRLPSVSCHEEVDLI
jgi:hypothetical protein